MAEEDFMVDPGISVQYGIRNPSFPWATVITSVLTALAALAGSWLVNRHQTKLQDRRLTVKEDARRRTALRANGEELVRLSDEWLRTFIAGTDLIKAELAGNDLTPDTVRKGMDTGTMSERIRLLVDIDFPEASATQDALDTIWNRAMALLERTQLNARSKADLKDALDQLHGLQSEALVLSKVFRKAVVELIKGKCLA